jgi:hypothetical protein
MSELFMDVLPEEALVGTYRVVLLGYRAGAQPRIERIAAEDLLQRLQTVLHWPKPTIDRLRNDLIKTDRLKSERLESPTKEQLEKLGFDV